MLRNKSQKLKVKRQKFGLKLSSPILYFLLFTFYFLLSCYGQEEFTYDARGRRNPFIPLVTSDGRLTKLDKDKEEVKGELSLEGIIYDKHGRSYALVNGSVVAVSDFVGEYQVLKIEQNKVIFIKDGQPLELELTRRENEN